MKFKVLSQNMYYDIECDDLSVDEGILSLIKDKQRIWLFKEWSHIKTAEAK